MRTHLALDDRLVQEAQRPGKHRTKREAVNQALGEYVARRKRKHILRYFGKVDWVPAYDYKAERKRRG